MPHTAQRVPARSCLWRKLWPLQPVSSSRDSVAAATGGARSRRVDGDDDRRLCVLVQGRRPSSPQVRLRGNLLLHRHLRRPARLHRDHRRRLEGRRHVDQPWSPQLQERLEVKACLGRAPGCVGGHGVRVCSVFEGLHSVPSPGRPQTVHGTVRRGLHDCDQATPAQPLVRLHFTRRRTIPINAGEEERGGRVQKRVVLAGVSGWRRWLGAVETRTGSRCQGLHCKLKRKNPHSFIHLC
mmetsp:Transcript_22700/g.53683  ORF Transcript_22700/g.53683 Transcript_22700/m.53683 type:complete len:239 (+) Transcript_22700:535-1251(+)